MGSVKKTCDVCGTVHRVKQADLNRGWGKTCSKSCAAKLREVSKPNYNPKRVAENNVRRKNWHQDMMDDYYEDDRHPFDDHEYWNSKDY